MVGVAVKPPDEPLRKGETVVLPSLPAASPLPVPSPDGVQSVPHRHSRYRCNYLTVIGSGIKILWRSRSHGLKMEYFQQANDILGR